MFRRLRFLFLAVFLILGVGPIAATVDFDKVIRPVIEQRCLVCHKDSNELGGLSLESRQAAINGGNQGAAIVTGNPAQSLFYIRMTHPAGEPGVMPPTGPQVPENILEDIATWIREGAIWSTPLQSPSKPAGIEIGSRSFDLTRRIHSRILQQAKREESTEFAFYEQKIPDSSATMHMVPIPSGEFMMGTADSELGRGEDEGPRHRVQVDAFWMGIHEISWDVFRPFMLREADIYRDPDALAAAISTPTPPYVEMSFGMGIKGYPAISMTQHAASKYAEWLSAKTGRFYRLPTEAEWEFACRAGSDTAYSFGNDSSQLAEHGWHWENSDGQYRPIGTLEPNAWGLFDMHGNVWEWTLDQYKPTYISTDQIQINPWAQANKLYPRVVRGGSWMDDAELLRCGARRGSDENWKMQDPQLPKSIWYHTDAQWLGFRLVRPLKIPTPEEMHAYWNSATGKK